MIALKNNRIAEEFVVIHPLFDAPEEKRNGAELGRMPMSPSVRISLLLLRGYLVVMSILLVVHMVDSLHVFDRHVGK